MIEIDDNKKKWRGWSAYLPDGRRMGYYDYIQTPEWYAKRQERARFDNFKCAICHEPLVDGCWQTHHLTYLRLGHEDVEHDLISICVDEHDAFHRRWIPEDYWLENEPDHWDFFNLDATAALCHEYFDRDYIFGGDLNLCNKEQIQYVIDDFIGEHNLHVPISEQDVLLFFRNRRYQIMIDAEIDAKKNPKEFEAFLDSWFGKKGSRTTPPNEIRSKARSFFSKHTLDRMIYHRNLLPHIIMLEQVVLDLEKENKNHA